MAAHTNGPLPCASQPRLISASYSHAGCRRRYGAPTSKYPPNGVYRNGSEWKNDWNISAWANLTRAMIRFGVGNGFDPLGGDLEDIVNASKLGWPVSLYPLHGGNLCFQVPSCVK